VYSSVVKTVLFLMGLGLVSLAPANTPAVIIDKCL
jgi:hypothetical protein